MFRKIWNEYKKLAFHASLGRALTSMMVVVFIAFMIVMVEFAIPSGDFKLIIKLGISYVIVNVIRAVATFYEDFSDNNLQRNMEADYREKIFVKLQNMKQIEMDQLSAGGILENMLNDTKEIARYWTWGIDRSYTGGLLRLVGCFDVFECSDYLCDIANLCHRICGCFWVSKKVSSFYGTQKENQWRNFEFFQ